VLDEEEACNKRIVVDVIYCYDGQAGLNIDKLLEGEFWMWTGLIGHKLCNRGQVRRKKLLKWRRKQREIAWV
jgi:hypothetical protein